MISIIVAADRNNAIGKDNKLPWKLKKDLKNFKEKTLGNPILMGRKTFESLGKPLINRLNIVVTRDKDFKTDPSVLIFNNIKDAIDRLENENVAESFIIGGGQIYQMVLPLVDRIYMTRVDCEIETPDAFFPGIREEHFSMIWEQSHDKDENNEHPFKFQIYERLH